MQWEIQRPGVLTTAGTLSAVSCPSRSWCVAVGGDYDFGSLAMWNGRTWRVQRSRRWTEPFVAISCLSTRFCLAVGGEATLAPGVALRWNGRRWHFATVRLGEALFGISCVSSSGRTTVGSAVENCFDCSAWSLVGRWNGLRWSIHNAPEPPNDRGFDSHLVGARPVTAVAASRRSATRSGRAKPRSGYGVWTTMLPPPSGNWPWLLVVPAW